MNEILDRADAFVKAGALLKGNLGDFELKLVWQCELLSRQSAPELWGMTIHLAAEYLGRGEGELGAALQMCNKLLGAAPQTTASCSSRGLAVLSEPDSCAQSATSAPTGAGRCVG